jgi:hypothetical protein
VPPCDDVMAWAYHQFVTWLWELFRGYTTLLIFAMVMMTIWGVVTGIKWLWKQRPGRRP